MLIYTAGPILRIWTSVRMADRWRLCARSRRESRIAMHRLAPCFLPVRLDTSQILPCPTVSLDLPERTAAGPEQSRTEQDYRKVRDTEDLIIGRVLLERLAARKIGLECRLVRLARPIIPPPVEGKINSRVSGLSSQVRSQAPA